MDTSVIQTGLAFNAGLGVFDGSAVAVTASVEAPDLAFDAGTLQTIIGDDSALNRLGIKRFELPWKRGQAEEVWRAIVESNGGGAATGSASAPGGTGAGGGAGDGSSAKKLEQAERLLSRSIENIRPPIAYSVVYVLECYENFVMGLLHIPTPLEVSQEERNQPRWQKVFRDTGHYLALMELNRVVNNLFNESSATDRLIPRAREHFEQLDDPVALKLVDTIQQAVASIRTLKSRLFWAR